MHMGLALGLGLALFCVSSCLFVLVVSFLEIVVFCSGNTSSLSLFFSSGVCACLVFCCLNTTRRLISKWCVFCRFERRLYWT